MEKTVVGLVEKITMNGSDIDETILARIDSGATKSSVDLRLASKLKLGPIVKSMIVKSAHGTKLRPVIEAEINICDRQITSEFTLADRSHMKYRVLIGQNILKQGFLIDPSKESSTEEKKKTEGNL